jgi:uncharacterized protein YprB with RNaseH-like and TPR domain
MISTGIFDIETSDLAADRGIILCAVIQGSDRKTPQIFRTDELNKGWKRGKRGDDSEITKQLTKALSNYDVLVAHNGTRFDVPFIRTRLARWGLDRFPDVKIIDPLSIAFRKFRLNRNSLGSISDFIGSADRKHALDWSIWMDCILNGSTAAMDEIVTHCVADVRELNDVLALVKPYVKVLDDRGSAL